MMYNSTTIAVTPRIPTLCLNMIVKNESRVILRLLESVYPIIDSYCICDTGSTDNTIELIEDFFEKKVISGCIVHHPFTDFGTNRSYSLRECNAQSSCDYILLLDADMVFVIPPSTSPESIKAALTDDMYFMFQGTDSFFYKNCRIIRNVPGYSYWGVTHEYLKSPENAKQTTLPKELVFIHDVGDGGSKSDKSVRDTRLLLNGLIALPDNDRYTFYLANTYHDSGDFANAIIYYKKRVELGGWAEECWYSIYRIGNCYLNMGDNANAVYYWLKAYSHTPCRIESLYNLVKHYRTEGANRVAYEFYSMAESERNNMTNWDYLFLEKEIYEFKLDYELSIVGYYCKDMCDNEYLIRTCMTVLAHPLADETMCNNVMSNFKFYTVALEDLVSKNTTLDKNREMILRVGDYLVDEGFATSTPTLCLDNYGRLVVGVRFVDYRIGEDGGYINNDAGTIITRNIITIYNIRNPNEWTKIDEFELWHDAKRDGRYVGLEDLRLFRAEGSSVIHYSANRGLADGDMVVEHGKIDFEEGRCITDRPIKYSKSTHLEKNWVLFDAIEPGEDSLINCVYKWFPLTIGALNKPYHTLTGVTETSTPNFFRFMRGSTNGVSIGNEVWFMTHVVSYEDKRHYYHCVVVIDRNTHKLKKYTPLMTFAKNAVEYSLGLVFFPTTNNFMIGYSVMDRETRYMMISKKHFNDMMIFV